MYGLVTMWVVKKKPKLIFPKWLETGVLVPSRSDNKPNMIIIKYAIYYDCLSQDILK